MAGNSLRRLWSWISIVILPGCFLCSNDHRTPCFPYFSDEIETNYSRVETEIIIFLREKCHLETNVTAIENYLNRSDYNVRITVVPLSLSCEATSWGLDALLSILRQSRTKALVAALDFPMCEVTVNLANLWNIPLFTWTCPSTKIKRREEGSPIVRLSPSLPVIAKAMTEMLLHLQWKNVVVIGTDREPWTSLDQVLRNTLESVGVALRYHVILPSRAASRKQVGQILSPTYNISRRATLLCLPLSEDGDQGGDELISRVLIELDVARQSFNSIRDSMTVILHTEDNDLFVPKKTSPSKPFSSLDLTGSRSIDIEEEAEYDELGENLQNDQENERRFFPLKNLSSAFSERLLILTPLDCKYDALQLYLGSQQYDVPSLLDRLNETLNAILYSRSDINAFDNKMYAYALLDWRTNAWNPIMVADESEDGKLLVRRLMEDAAAFQDSTDISMCGVQTGTEDITDRGCTESDFNVPATFRATHVVAIVLASLFTTLAALLLAVFLRKRLLEKRMSKGPYKIVLTTSDFVFPQVPPQADSRRVNEGIETMLCCWLQQLQEFGGPEVEKPDLLQLGSVSSLKPYLRASTGNLTRHNLFKDPRARYNGDLVQLKELPSQGTFELKNKAMDALITIHGLRHENLNPLIGCLNEPTRPCLVYEYCSRGSLEDVLMQDEIKLDWSFRLSLLTDLVRGMRYLHGTPVRVHGYLTSRNCVIDARWVLKLTDYGLPAFYDAQNCPAPAKTARELLWTAPELLRHPSLRKKGTQAGDVYSFGIIMQEVVVRGEPFCMLALSPEDIIEKVMKPPPLIRPSVSKGAAPPEAINIMRQCWAEAADMRPDFNDVHDLFKKLNHGRKVNFVDTMFQMLEKYSNNLEELIRERTEQLDMEKKKTEQLLNRMLPSSVAEKLKLGMPVDPEEFREVTIYFSDIVGFTTISACSTPFQVVDLLNDLYTCFDATINAYTVYKVETIGDAYMVVGGCPVRIADHASQIATMALDLLHQSGKFKLRHLPETQLRLRIGLHTGPCCAGVVGLTMPRYCLFGDTVNTASRMESTGAPWRIHLSQATRDRLAQAGGYRIEYRGPTEVKGKGKMPTYWLLGKQGFEKELPTPPPLGLNESLTLENVTDEETGRSDLSNSETTIEGEWEWGMRNRKEDDNTNGVEKVQVERRLKIEQQQVEASRNVVVSVHNEKSISPSCSSNLLTNIEEISSSPKKATDEGERYDPTSVTKSASADVQVPSLAASSMFCGETNSNVLASSTSSLASISTSLPYRPTAPSRYRKIVAGYIDENDLSTPYNHYRCLSPNEHHGRNSACRFLKRQFSLDRPDEPCAAAIADQNSFHQQEHSLKTTPKLFKQNSAGAANDLERIEEVPSTPVPLLQHYRQAASVSLSVESLTFR